MTRGEVETMRVLITGAGGTLGAALAPLLAEAGHEPVRIHGSALRLADKGPGAEDSDTTHEAGSPAVPAVADR